MSAASRLTRLLGLPSQQLSERDLARIVELSVQEEEDLDFKQSLYGTSDGDKRSLAGDVAAMANSVGGVLVLGIREEEGSAAELTAVAIAEDEGIRIPFLSG